MTPRDFAEIENEKAIKIIESYTQDVMKEEDLFFMISNKIISDLVFAIMKKGQNKIKYCNTGRNLVEQVFLPVLENYIKSLKKIYSSFEDIRKTIEEKKEPESPKKEDGIPLNLKALNLVSRKMIGDFFENCEQYYEYLIGATLGVVFSQIQRDLNHQAGEEVTTAGVFRLIKKSLEECLVTVDGQIQKHSEDEKVGS